MNMESPVAQRRLGDQDAIRRIKTQLAVHLRERDSKAATLRIQGSTFAEIAAQLGLRSSESARRASERGLREVQEPDLQSERIKEAIRLRRAARRIEEDLSQPLYRTYHGRVIMDPMNPGVPLTDPATLHSAYRELLRISQRYAKLLGLDAPLRRPAEEVTEQMVQDEIRRIEAQAEEAQLQLAAMGIEVPAMKEG
jgi:hypothetical protein